MYVEMKNSTELYIFMQCWRATAHSCAVPEQLRSSTRAVCEAGWFGYCRSKRVAMARCTHEDRATTAFRQVVGGMLSV